MTRNAMTRNGTIQNALQITLLGATLLGTPLAAAAQDSSQELFAETYGAPSGILDGILAEFGGLMIEVVRKDSDNPALRVFGGVPESAAVVLIGMAPADASTTLHVDSVIHRAAGQFDPWGYFEVPLGTLPEGYAVEAALYAQGITSNILGNEFSNGVMFGARGVVEERLELADLLPQLPDDRRDEVWSSLEHKHLTEMLRRGLNGAGDSMALNFELGLSSNFTIPGLDIGGSGAIEAKVSRTAGNTYEISIDRSVALKAGVKLPGTSVGVYGGRGLARRIVYSFDSADGAVHGLIGIAFSQTIGKGIDLPELDRGALDRAEEVYEAARQLMLEAQARVAWAQRRVNDLWRAYHSERKWWRRAAIRAAIGTATVTLRVAETALEVALHATATAKAVVDRVREEFAVVFDTLRLVRNLIWKSTQVFTFADQHRHGSELRFSSSASVNLELGPVRIPNIGFGFSASVDRKFIVYREYAKNDGGPERITVRVRQDKTVAATGSFTLLPGLQKNLPNIGDEITNLFSFGGELKATNYIEFADTFEISLSHLAHDGATVTFGRDIEATAQVGGGLSARGVGREVSMTLSVGDVLSSIGNTGAAIIDLDPDALVSALGSFHATVKLQDRYKNGFQAGLSVKVDIVNLSIGVSAMWTDQGEPIEQDISVADVFKRGGEEVSNGLSVLLPM